LTGIGYAAAEALIENGAHVTISASNPDKAKQTVDRLLKSYPSASSRVKGEACNLSDEATLERNVEELLARVGKIDHLIHTAGDGLKPSPPSEFTMEYLKKVGMVRFFAPLIIAKHVTKYISPGPNSSITLTTGTVSEKPIAGWTAIGSYATGLQGMTRQLALDLKPIRVNLVSPGAVKTELWGSSGFSEEQTKNMLEGISSKLPTGKVPGPEELAECYLYLLKDKNITGTMISSNGGTLLT
jgi:NAD(P)-dependent dehydrogenase (short-subunit alcohol dehydrogenase family)